MSDDISDVIDDFAIDVTYSRTAVGSTVKGRYTPGVVSTGNKLTASITPATPNDLRRLPEGRRTEEVIRILTKQQLLMLPQADLVQYNGSTWEVQAVAPWANAVTFYDCLAVKVTKP